MAWEQIFMQRDTNFFRCNRFEWIPFNSEIDMPSKRSDRFRSFYQTFVCFAALLLWSCAGLCVAQAQTVTTVSAASFTADAPLAPDSIVAAFGQKLATGTVVATAQPLPTTLGGTTVRINGQAAPLFFVSPGQINFAIPAGVSPGTATVNVMAGDGAVSTGTVQIAAASPGIFSANANGAGAPAAVLVRVAGNGVQTFESVTQFNSSLNQQVPRPIDLGPDGERVFLVLFLSGLRGATDPNNDGNLRENVRMLIGGLEVMPDFAGKQTALAGLDQVNAEIPRSLIGRGLVNVCVTVNNAPASNLVEIDIAPRPAAASPAVNSFTPNNVLAGNDMTINGSGFSFNLSDMLVRIGGSEAEVLSATPSTLNVRVPYGVAGGPLTVRTLQTEGSSNPRTVGVRTSISGFIEDTNRQAIAGVTARLRNSMITDTSSEEGIFILPDITAPGLALVDIDPSTAPGGLPYPALTVKKDVATNRDNVLDRPVALEAATGPSVTVGSGTGTVAPPAGEETTSAENDTEPAGPSATSALITTEGITFEVGGNATAVFPNGQTQGRITLTAVRNSRTPVNLPAGIFSSSIAQLTPFRVRITPGGKLSFPNPDGIPAGTQARLYKFDQTANSPTIGGFIQVGLAQVSADGSRIETLPGAITETSLYFVAVPRPTTTVIGRVFESNGTTPVRRALIRFRGQEAFTDGNGGFILRQVPVNSGERVQIEASFQRPSGRIDRALSNATLVVIGGLTNVGPILLPTPQNAQQPILIGLPNSLVVTENIDSRFIFQSLDPTDGIPQVSVTGANFASVAVASLPNYTLAFSPKTGTAGNYKITVTSVAKGGTRSFTFPLRVNRAPLANAQNVQVARNTPKTITVTGSDPDQDPINFVLDTPPKNGKLSGDFPNITYTPATGFVGTDVFLVKANDGYADSPAARITLVVEGPPANAAPVLTVPGSQTPSAGTTLTFTVSAADQNTDQTLTLAATGLPPNASFTTRDANPIIGNFIWRIPANAGPQTITVNFTATDSGNPKLSDSKSVVIRVTALN